MNQLGITNYSYKSPLRYPGGKTKAWKFFEQVLPKGISTLTSPFLGGGGIELCCSVNGIHVTASDNFEPLVNFWQELQIDSEALVNLALGIFPLSLEHRFHFYKNKLARNCVNPFGHKMTDFERAAIFLIMNRLSWSGQTLASTPFKIKEEMMEKHKNSIKRLSGWSNNNISISCCDYTETFSKVNENDFCYLDPPYVGTEGYYGSPFDNNKFDHHKFYEEVKNLSCSWILSYKKHEFVTDLYKDYRIIEYGLNYSMPQTITDKATELFIVNY